MLPDTYGRYLYCVFFFFFFLRPDQFECHFAVFILFILGWLCGLFPGQSGYHCVVGQNKEAQHMADEMDAQAEGAANLASANTNAISDLGTAVDGVVSDNMLQVSGS